MMSSLVDAIRQEPELAQWLATPAWRKSFDRGSLSRAISYQHERIIAITEIETIANAKIFTKAQVKGTRSIPYRTEVYFRRHEKNWSVATNCSCPVGLYCKHGAAIIFAATEALTPTAPMASLAQKPPQPILDYRLAEWLEGLRKASSTKAPKANPTQESRFLAFCLQPGTAYNYSTKPWYLFLRSGTRSRDGSFKISDSMAKADPANPPKYMTREDLIAASLYYQLKRKHNAWSELQFEGEGWDELLEAIQLTERFFVLAEGSHRWVPVTTGPELQVETGWETLPNGNMRPQILFTDGMERVIIPTVPPRYIERETGVLGTLTGNLPAALLAAWMKGPTVEAGQVERLSQELQQVSPIVPPLVPLETVNLPAISPNPHLVIRKQKFGKGFNAEDIIFGLLQFRYGKGKPLSRLSNQEQPIASEIRGGKQYLQRRDPKAEKAAEKRLRKLGLGSIEEFIMPQALNEETRQGFIPVDLQGSSFRE